MYVRMARLALERWRELEDQAGQELLRVVGGLDVGEATEASAAALEEAGERFERPSDAEVAERWPMLRFPPGSRFVYQPDGAVLRSREAVMVMATLAEGHGAELREETRVESVAPSGDGVEVTTRDGAIGAPVAIVAAGSWTGSLLEPAGISLDLRPTLEQSTYFDADARDLPTVIDWDETPEEPPYIVPDPFEPGRIKAGAHLSGRPVDPETRSLRGRRARGGTGRRLGRPPPRVSGFRAQDRDVPLHEDAGRGLRARPGRTARGRLTLQRSRVQVRAADRRGARRHGHR